MPPEYYSPRYLILAGVSIAVGIYFYIYSYFVTKHEFISLLNPKLDVNDLLFVEFLIVGVICFICFPGILFNFKNRINIPSLEWIIISPTRNVVLLVTASVFFIVLISLPAFFMGGATKSNFAVLLIAMATLVVVVTNNPWIRIALAIVSCSAFVLSSIYFVDIEINIPRTYSNFYTATSIFAVFLALVLSWRGEFSIFGKASSKTAEDFLGEHLAPQLEEMAVSLHKYILTMAPEDGPEIMSFVYDKWNKRISYRVLGKDAFWFIEPRASTLIIEFTNASKIIDPSNMLKRRLFIFKKKKVLRIKYLFGMKPEKVEELQERLSLLQPIIESAAKNSIEEPLRSTKLTFPEPTLNKDIKDKNQRKKDES